MDTATQDRTVDSAEPRRFVRSVLVVSGGTIAAQALAAASGPVLTRLFSPSDFGILGVYMALLGIVSTGVTLRYDFAIPLAASESEAANVFALSVGIAAANSCLLLVLLVVLKSRLSVWLDATGFSRYVLWLPLAILATALYRSLSAWAIRRREYNALAATKVTQTVGMVGFQIGSGVLRAGAVGLVIGHVIGQAGGSGALARRTLLAKRDYLRSVSVAEMRRVARKFVRFPRFSAAAAFLNSCSEALPVLCFVWMFGPVVTGWYTLVQRVLYVPGSAVVLSVSQVFFGEICLLQRANRRDLIRKSYIQRFRQLLLLGLGGAVIAAVLAPHFIPLAFGEKWRNAGQCIQIFAPYFACWLPASSLAGVLDTFQRQDLHLRREVVRAVLLLLGLSGAYLCAADWVHTFAVISLVYTLDMIHYAALSWKSLGPADAGPKEDATSASRMVLPQ